MLYEQREKFTLTKTFERTEHKTHVTMKDIAQRANVSIVTVSKALAEKEALVRNLKKKIVECADKMGTG